MTEKDIDKKILHKIVNEHCFDNAINFKCVDRFTIINDGNNILVTFKYNDVEWGSIDDLSNGRFKTNVRVDRYDMSMKEYTKLHRKKGLKTLLNG